MKRMAIFLLVSMITLTACGTKAGNAENLSDVDKSQNEIRKENTIENSEYSSDSEEVLTEEDSDINDNTEYEVNADSEVSQDTLEDTDAGEDESKEENVEEEIGAPVFPEVYREFCDFNWYSPELEDDYLAYHYEGIKLSKESEKAYPELSLALSQYSDEKWQEDKESYEMLRAEWEGSEYVENPSVMPLFKQERNVFVRRADGRIFSFASRLGIFSAFDVPVYSYDAYNYDMQTGSKIELSDVVKDKDALFKLLSDEAQKIIVDLDNGTPFTIDPYGMTFYFESDKLESGMCTETVLFSEDKNGNIFNQDLCSEPDNWIESIPLDEDIVYEENNSGQHEKVCVSLKNEVKIITGYFVTTNNKQNTISTDGEASDVKSFLVHTGGKHYLMMGYSSSNGGAVDLVCLDGQDIAITDRITGTFSSLAESETDFTKVSSCPISIPIDAGHIDIVSVGGSSLFQYGITDSGEFGPAAGTDIIVEENTLRYADEYEAYENILYCYAGIQNGDYSTENLTDLGITSALFDIGWPSSVTSDNDNDYGYCLYDADSNGIKELFITYGGSIYDIFSFADGELRYAYGVPYRGQAFLYDTGMVKQLFGSMSSASEKFYKLNENIGVYLPVADKTYTPKEHDTDPDDTEYHAFTSETTWKDIETFYKENGNIPVWAYEWSDEISKDEYEEVASNGSEVTLVGIEPLSGFTGF